jgi:hypothetical protein
MMVVMPPVIQTLGLDPLVGGAWLGGTIDATGAVVAAGEALGKEAGAVAANPMATAPIRETDPFLRPLDFRSPIGGSMGPAFSAMNEVSHSSAGLVGCQ